eukprot:TRINITY_DN4509_c0_g2_i1.p1 TRINITY_DN4509_c0_g2~~TRINITY_DN4509_c0_g2_i1.p1  ORF type:complete len:335 (+),score=51.94 TRINITY_DN4509_c0_g2_i1:74-1078(+)
MAGKLSLMDLPREVIAVICDQCTDTSVCALERSCTELRETVSQQDVWRTRFAKRFPYIKVKDDCSYKFEYSRRAKCSPNWLDPSFAPKSTALSHGGSVNALSLTETHIVSGADDRNVYIWDQRTLQMKCRLDTNAGRCMAVSALGESHVVSGGYDGGDNVQYWDIEQQARVRLYAGHHSACRAVVVLDAVTACSGGEDCHIRVWDLRSQDEAQNVQGHDRCVSSLLRVDENVLYSGGWDGRICQWDLRKMQAAVIAQSVFSCSVYSLSYNGMHLAVGSSEGDVTIFDGAMQRRDYGNLSDDATEAIFLDEAFLRVRSIFSFASITIYTWLYSFA